MVQLGLISPSQLWHRQVIQGKRYYSQNKIGWYNILKGGGNRLEFGISISRIDYTQSQHVRNLSTVSFNANRGPVNLTDKIRSANRLADLILEFT